MPMVELIDQGQLAVEELVGQLGKAALEAVLLVSVHQTAGPRQSVRTRDVQVDPYPARVGSPVGAGCEDGLRGRLTAKW